MTELRRKLKSCSGASMLLALLFLFFCLTVGAVVLTAASASAGRTERNRRQQQEYLAVQSAANLLIDDMADMEYKASYTYKKITTYTTETDAEGNSVVTSSTRYEYGVPFTSELSGTAFKNLFSDYCRDLFRSAPALDGYRNWPPVAPQPSHHAFTLSVPEEEGRELPAVEVSLTMGVPSPAAQTYSDNHYTITAELSLAGAPAAGENRMTVVLQPAVSIPIITHTPTWGNPDVEAITVDWTVTWKAAEVTKGGTP